MGIKNFFLKKAIKHKTKDMPQNQQEMVMKLVEDNPELFEKIGNEIQHKIKKEGKSQMAATMEVMRKYQGDIQKLQQ